MPLSDAQGRARDKHLINNKNSTRMTYDSNSKRSPLKSNPRYDPNPEPGAGVPAGGTPRRKVGWSIGMPLMIIRFKFPRRQSGAALAVAAACCAAWLALAAPAVAQTASCSDWEALFRSGSAADIERCIAASTDVNATTEGGYTPLHVAADWLSVEGVRLLLGAGADARAKNDMERDTPAQGDALARG